MKQTLFWINQFICNPSKYKNVQKDSKVLFAIVDIGFGHIYPVLKEWKENFNFFCWRYSLPFNNIIRDGWITHRKYFGFISMFFEQLNIFLPKYIECLYMLLFILLCLSPVYTQTLILLKNNYEHLS